MLGTVARVPFAVAPGMEINAYAAFFMAGVLHFTAPQVLGAVFWSGVLFLVLSLTRIRQQLIEAFPEQMKIAVSVSVGAILIAVALKIGDLVVYSESRIIRLGDPFSRSALILYSGFAVAILIRRFNRSMCVLVSILAAAVFAHLAGPAAVQGPSESFRFERFASAFGTADLSVLLDFRVLSPVLLLFLLDFYGSVAKLIGLLLNTSIQVNGHLPRLTSALVIDSSSTIVGSLLGTSSLTVFVESGAGIAAGGRTGLTAATCGVLMLSTLVLFPLLKFLPLVASTGALAYVGCTLFPAAADLTRLARFDRFVLFGMVLITLFTFSLDRPLLFGFLAYLCRDFVLTRRFSIFALGSSLLLGAGVMIQGGW